MHINENQSGDIQEIIRGVYSRNINEDFLLQLAPFINRILDAHYFAALLFPNRFTNKKLLISNNDQEFLDAYNPVISNDFLMKTLVDTNKPVLFSELNKNDFHGKSEFLAETQKVRPVSDCIYVPLKVGQSLTGFVGIARAGLKSPHFSKNDLDIFNFISAFLSEGLKRDLYIAAEDEDTAYLNAYGQVVTAGNRISMALKELFGERFHKIPRHGFNEHSYHFNQFLEQFQNPIRSPGSGNLWLAKKGREYHFTIKEIAYPHYRPYCFSEPQLVMTLAKENDYPEKEDLLDFSALELIYELTAREKDVIRCIYKGFSNREISLKLKIAESTVKRHIWNIFNKTGAENRTQLIFQFSS